MREDEGCVSQAGVVVSHDLPCGMLVGEHAEGRTWSLRYQRLLR
jgi:hypothetical protein